MNPEKEPNEQTEDKATKGVRKKVHQTHFSVPEKVSLDNSYDTGYEWVRSGNGRWRLVIKKHGKRDKSSPSH